MHRAVEDGHVDERGWQTIHDHRVLVHTAPWQVRNLEVKFGELDGKAVVRVGAQERRESEVLCVDGAWMGAHGGKWVVHGRRGMMEGRPDKVHERRLAVFVQLVVLVVVKFREECLLFIRIEQCISLEELVVRVELLNDRRLCTVEYPVCDLVSVLLTKWDRALTNVNGHVRNNVVLDDLLQDGLSEWREEEEPKLGRKPFKSAICWSEDCR